MGRERKRKKGCMFHGAYSSKKQVGSKKAADRAGGAGRDSEAPRLRGCEARNDRERERTR